MAKTTRAEWAGRVQRWKESGQTKEEFAAANGCNAGTLGWWRSRLRKEAREPIGFVEVALAAPPAGRVEIVLRSGVRIAVSGAFDAEVLRRAVAALETRS